MKTNLIVLASGFSKRFGSNKLLYEYQGKKLILHTLDKINKNDFNQVIVVSQYPEIIDIAHSYGFEGVFNPQATKGISQSIKLGITYSQNSDQAMFLVADMPNFNSIQKLLAKADGKHIVSSGNIQNPMIFPSFLYNEILELEKDQGAKKIALKHLDIVIQVDIDKNELKDIDSLEDVA